MRPTHRLSVETTWDGLPCLPSEAAEVRFALGEGRLEVSVTARFHRDPAPCSPPGRLDRLWEHEVVELFLVADGDRYLELEFGPHGNYLALTFSGPRRLVRADLPLEYASAVDNDRFRARASLAARHVPRPIVRCNAFSIHGVGEHRRYLAASPLPGKVADFHRIHDYPSERLWRAPPRAARS